MISKQLKNLKNKKIGNWKYLKSLKNCTEHVREFAEMEIHYMKTFTFK